MQLLKKYILVILLSGIFFPALAQPKYEVRNDDISQQQQLRISKLHELIVVDSDSDKNEIGPRLHDDSDSDNDIGFQFWDNSIKS